LTPVGAPRSEAVAMIAWLALLVALCAALLAWRLRRRLADAEQQLRETRLLRRELDELRGEGARGLAVTRAHLAAVAAGEPPAREAIVAGTPWSDVQPAAALALWERSPALFVLDVRSQAEWSRGRIPRAHLVPLDELEDRLGELPPKDAPVLVHCAAGGRSREACELLARHGFTRLLNLVGGLHTWPGPREETAPPAGAVGTVVTYHGGQVTEADVVAAIRECYDPEIPLNVYDLGLVYGIDIAESAIAVRMTLTSESCPSARTIPEEVRQRVAALGQPNVSVDVVWDPPWHPARISPEGKQKLGLV
jgi:metal-sulfur cluster biosynthetic enzyme/rhodanese-related sulfurtransferase